MKSRRVSCPVPIQVQRDRERERFIETESKQLLKKQ